jgi:hypothetical protein
MASTPSASSSAGKWIVILIAMLVPFGFAVFTNHVWEDYYITLRSSRNLIEGHGLVFQPGERVHTFTSPLGVLIPALWLWAGGGNDTIALWLFRLTNIAVLAATAGLLLNACKSIRLGRVGCFVFFGLVFFDPKLIDFSINGQETALLLFFTVLLWGQLEREDGPRPMRLALAYAGLMWTRPDAFILAGAITIAHLLWRDSKETKTKPSWPSIWRGALIGVLMYIPWVIWAWYYYGSPIPNTIIAKASQTPALPAAEFGLIPLRSIAGQTMLDYLFLPSNFLFGGWPRPLLVVAHGLTLLATFGWVVPGVPRSGRRASFAVFLGMFYLCAILVFAWYVPPWSFLAAMAVAIIADAALSASERAARRTLSSMLRITVLSVIAVQFAVLLATAWQMRIQQRTIEDNGRHAIGDWLRTHAEKGDTVFMEPLGYIGYFSQLKTYDFPGLSSREVVAAIHSGAKRYADVVARLNPTWLVLRPVQNARQGFDPQGKIPGYHEVRRWDAQPQLDAIRFLPGRRWLEYDATFILYHHDN